jgi:hypothetical protein
VTATLESLLGIDAALAAKGHHPLTPWWRDTLGRWYATPGANTLVGRVGRGGAKSHTSVKVSLNETLYGNWSVPPGERHFWAYVSKSKDEAAQRLLLIERFLRDLGIGFDRQGDEIALRDLPRGWRVFAATIGAVSGFRCFGYSADELAKWQAGTDLANPAGEVCASLNAMTITHPGARRVLISSPLGTLDYHHECFARGDTADQITAVAPSWVANPNGITEEQTHKAEPDERVWRREYAAIPQAGLSSAFDPAAVERAFRSPPVAADSAAPVCIVDASSGGGDAFTWAIAQYVLPAVPDGVTPYLMRQVPRRVHTVQNGREVVLQSPETIEQFELDERGRRVPNPEFTRARVPTLVIRKVDAVEGRFAGSVAGSDIVKRIADECRRWGVSTVLGDQRESFFLGSEFLRHRIRFVPIAWTNQNKIEAVTRLKRMFAENALALPPSREKMKRELLSYAERITASGTITYSARGTGHDDEAALLITFALGELERLVPGSPMGGTGKGVVSGPTLY